MWKITIYVKWRRIITLILMDMLFNFKGITPTLTSLPMRTTLKVNLHLFSHMLESHHVFFPLRNLVPLFLVIQSRIPHCHSLTLMVLMILISICLMKLKLIMKCLTFLLILLLNSRCRLFNTTCENPGIHTWLYIQYFN